jgi:hypothetical protein
MSTWQQRITLFWQLAPIMTAMALVLASILFIARFILQTGPDLIAPNDLPLGADYLSLWSAGWLALTGNPAGAYDPATISAAHHVGMAAANNLTLFHYPPVFLLVLAPLASLPYLPSLILFVGFTGLIWLYLLWRLRPHWTTLLFALAYPAFWLNVLSGQNAFLTGSLLLSGLLSTTARGRGLALSGICYKPQLALVLPFALLAQRQGKALLWLALGCAGLSLASLVIFGPAIWKAFLENSSNPMIILAEGRIPLERMASAFAMVLNLNGNLTTAFIAQGLIGLSGLLFVVAIWKNASTSLNIKWIALSIAMLMVTPHLFHYDLAILALPLILWLREAEQTRWLTGERPLLFALWLAPFYALPSSGTSDINFYPFLYICLFLFLLRRQKIICQ